MKRLMFMTNSLYGGGAEKVLQTLLKNIDYDKYDVTLYSLHREKIDPFLYPKEVHYKVVFDTYSGKSVFLKGIWGIFSKVRGKIFCMFPSGLFYAFFIHGNYDVEIAFIEGESTKIVSGSINRHSRKLAWVHIDLQSNPWTSFLYRNDADERKCYQKYDQILCVSDSVRKAFIEKYEINPCVVKTQYNPVDRKEILGLAKESCRLPDKTKFRMIAVGRLVKQKGFDRLLRIVLRLKQNGQDFELYILGEGEERGALEDYIILHKLENTVFLLGFQKNPYSYMKMCDLLVCSSRAEGFSTVISEGVVLGLPIVSTDCAGVKELFGNFECGVITENSEEALYQALYQVLNSRENLEKYRQGALKRGEYFSIEKTMKELEELFDG